MPITANRLRAVLTEANAFREDSLRLRESVLAIISHFEPSQPNSTQLFSALRDALSLHSPLSERALSVENHLMAKNARKNDREAARLRRRRAEQPTANVRPAWQPPATNISAEPNAPQGSFLPLSPEDIQRAVRQQATAADLTNETTNADNLGLEESDE